MSDESLGATLARYYDLDLAEDPGDVPLYLALADAHGGDVLELCAGSGRVSVPLAAAGHMVTGVDNDPAMLARASARWAAAGQAVTHGAPAGGHLELVMADVTSFRSDGRYSLAILALNSLLLLDGRTAQGKALATMARHLAPHGRAIIDVWLPTPEDLAIYDGRPVVEWVRRDDNNDWVAKTVSARYQPATNVAEIVTFFDAWTDDQAVRRSMRRDEIAFVGAHELVAMADQAGLEVETMAGDHELGPFETDSERVVLVCRPKGRRSESTG